jgi:hypothetical protein
MSIESLTIAARAAGYAMAPSEELSSDPLTPWPSESIGRHASDVDDYLHLHQPGVTTGHELSWTDRLAFWRVATQLPLLNGPAARTRSSVWSNPIQHFPKVPREPKMALALEQR